MSEPEHLIDRQPSVEIIGIAPEAQPTVVALFNNSGNETALLGALTDPMLADSPDFEAYVEHLLHYPDQEREEDRRTAANLVFTLLDAGGNGKLIDYDDATWGAIQSDPDYVTARNHFHQIRREGIAQEAARRRVALRGLAVWATRHATYREQMIRLESGIETAA